MMPRIVNPMMLRSDEERNTPMLKNHFLIIFVAITSIIVTYGCKQTSTQVKAEPTAQAKSEPTTQTKPEPAAQAKSERTAEATAQLSAATIAHVERILGDYEALRAALAGDRLSEVSAIASRLEQNVKTSI